MKLAIVLAVLCCLAIGTFASPVPKISEEKTSTQNVVATGRQAAPVAAVSEDDDDDDDDDDDVDFDITGDDDDDDDDEEDDDDDDDDSDYLERFIEDILGEEDDDDDEDEPSPAAAVVPAASPAPIAPSIPAAVEADLNSAAQEAEQAAETAAETTAVDNESTGAEDDETNTVVEGQAASAIHETPLEGAESVANSVHVPVVSTNVAGNEDDDDDDDDEDDVDLVYTEDDDDDDDEDDDEDDDDDDDVDSIADIAGARRARVMQSEPSNDVSSIYVAKYNRFVDNILGRINKILRSNYDPVTVKLTNPSTKTKTNKQQKMKSKTKKNNNKNGTKKSSLGVVTVATEKTIQKIPENTQKTLDVAEIVTMSTINAIEKEAINTTPSQFASRSNIESTMNSTSRRTSVANGKKKNKTRAGTKNKTKNQATSNKNKTKKNKPKARATLYGLASLQRSGDVSVNMMSDHTMIKTKFTLGPLILKVEKEFGRAAKKELRSATATTAEMSGKLSLRVLHGGAATLNSIRVLQPKQVRVESADDHDRTREFVWKRSSHIAHLVSEKLSSATRSMLQPPPVAVIAA